MITSCICEGQEVIYECVIDGYMTAGTYWRGSALHTCENGELLIRHSHFQSKRNASSSCGPTGKVEAYPISLHNNSYTSQLVITNVTEQLLNSSVSCETDFPNTIGIAVILLAGIEPKYIHAKFIVYTLFCSSTAFH